MNYDNFNPNDPASAESGIFGLPHTSENAQIILIPIHWEVTVSYGSGASLGPDAIKNASMQVDLCHHDFPELWKKGIWLDAFPDELHDLNYTMKKKAKVIIDALEAGSDKDFSNDYKIIEEACDTLNTWVAERVSHWKKLGKTVGLIGGDHSSPLGYMQYLSEVEKDFGVLTIDAHMDLRNAYEGFAFSHASVFYNALKIPSIQKMVQVGIRDYCHEEKEFAQENNKRLKIFYDREIRKSLYEGIHWKTICDEMIAELPEKIYISVDIDGLDPKLCPNTGTPVAGGLQYEELMYLFNRIKNSGKKIIGFDLCEVAPGSDEWDGNVGARVLYHLCGISA